LSHACDIGSVTLLVSEATKISCARADFRGFPFPLGRVLPPRLPFPTPGVPPAATSLPAALSASSPSSELSSPSSLAAEVIGFPGNAPSNDGVCRRDGVQLGAKLEGASVALAALMRCRLSSLASLSAWISRPNSDGGPFVHDLNLSSPPPIPTMTCSDGFQLRTLSSEGKAPCRRHYSERRTE